ncbi:signal transduction histidine kinase [Candidatus Moduliflexus flocculans]|uniref:histidine kinase n=1 Tax=Candidatus Moduliflexus flocculans TaxID=1499966 RepID=A0A081BNQ5_9BACT|nr:signal transduction histidine kinase [Candidatus Moduliflexus flocculans]
MESVNILIVEDDMIVAKSLQTALKNAGYRVCGIVHTAEAAIQHVQSVQTDLVLMDILLRGEISGIEAADTIYKQFHLPVIYISANSNQEIVDRAKTTDSFGFILKPFHAREIQIAIEMALYKSRMEQQLRQNEAKYRNVINQASEMISVIQDNRFVLVNTTALAMTGYSLEEAISSPYLEFTAPEDRPLVSEIIHKRLHGTEAPLSIETRLIRRDGTFCWIESRGTLIDWEGRPAVLVFANDITERKRAEAELLRYRDHLEELVQQRTIELSDTNAQLNWEINERKQMERSLLEQSTFLENIISGIQEGIGIIGADETILFCNRAFAFIFEEEIERLLGDNLRSFFDDENWAHLLRETELRMQGKTSTYELCLHTRYARQKFIQVTVSPRFDENAEYAGCFAVVLDITERKEREIELQRAKEAAEAANVAKNEFLASMSHELRTPLHGILGFAQLLKMDPDLTPKHQKHATLIERNGNHLLILLNDLLDLSKDDAGQLELTSSLFYLSQALVPVIEIAKYNAEEKQLAFRFEYDPSIPEAFVGDEKRLRQVLTNLIGNAVKFTPQGAVTLQVRLIGLTAAGHNGAPRSIAKLHFEVEDTGIGIPQHALQRIFLPFEHAKNRRLYSDGAGLGLALCQRFLRMMGSELFVKSTVGEGSVFWFTVDFPFLETAEIRQQFIPPTLNDAALILPSRDVLERLHHLASSGDILAIKKTLQSLDANGCPSRDFLAKLSRLAEKWQIDAIQESLAQALIKQRQAFTHGDTPSDSARSES